MRPWIPSMTTTAIPTAKTITAIRFPMDFKMDSSRTTKIISLSEISNSPEPTGFTARDLNSMMTSSGPRTSTAISRWTMRIIGRAWIHLTTTFNQDNLRMRIPFFRLRNLPCMIIFERKDFMNREKDHVSNNPNTTNSEKTIPTTSETSNHDDNLLPALLPLHLIPKQRPKPATHPQPTPDSPPKTPIWDKAPSPSSTALFTKYPVITPFPFLISVTFSPPSLLSKIAKITTHHPLYPFPSTPTPASRTFCQENKPSKSSKSFTHWTWPPCTIPTPRIA
mmetsp:Transcript_21591/g.44446  ORF Transcript_21591/g.44446 Transcript_21591/m.44446 type:complete len:279 (+) Transcript_21591:9-845(+)